MFLRTRQTQLPTSEGEVRSWKGCKVTASHHDEGHSREALSTIERPCVSSCLFHVDQADVFHLPTALSPMQLDLSPLVLYPPFSSAYLKQAQCCNSWYGESKLLHISKEEWYDQNSIQDCALCSQGRETVSLHRELSPMRQGGGQYGVSEAP